MLGRHCEFAADGAVYGVAEGRGHKVMMIAELAMW